MLKRVFLCFLAIMMVVTSCYVLPQMDDGMFAVSAATESELKKKQSDLEAQQASIKSKISQLESNQADAQEQVNALNELIENLEEQIYTVNQKIAVQEAEIADLQAEIDLTESQITDAYDAFKARVRAMYITGDFTGGLELLLTADDFDSYLTTMTYIELMAKHDDGIVNSLTEDKEGYQAQKAQIEEKRAEIEAEKLNLSSKKEELDEQKAEADALLSQIAADKAVLQQEQVKIDKEMQKAREALDAIIARKTAESDEKNHVPGAWRWPAPGYKRISSKFGWRSWSNSYHKGIDIAAPMGANIIASKGGKVVTSSYDAGGYGNYVIIDHGGGYMTVYGHLRSRAVSVGQQVNGGQSIGACGSTGRSTGPHLHFEIRVNGVAQNPTNYVG
ncbi:MAG: hypothetical protein E7554_03435 [Ruminococcaceae bacterium]|nr:hypothetical protein [Oscillospiraceae bacterium]